MIDYEIVKREDGSFLVDAQIPFYDFLCHFDKTEWMNEGEHEFDTLAGFMLHQLEHIPRTGERMEWKDFKFEIVDMDAQRIDKILVDRSAGKRTGLVRLPIADLDLLSCPHFSFQTPAPLWVSPCFPRHLRGILHLRSLYAFRVFPSYRFPFCQSFR